MRDYERAVYILTMQTDEYVILDKITRFRQDIQISVISNVEQHCGSVSLATCMTLRQLAC